jgi:hypothetical protein
LLIVAVIVTGCPASGPGGLSVTAVAVPPRTTVNITFAVPEHVNVSAAGQLIVTVYTPGGGAGNVNTAIEVGVVVEAISVCVYTAPATPAIVAVSDPLGPPTDPEAKLAVAVSTASEPYATLAGLKLPARLATPGVTVTITDVVLELPANTESPEYVAVITYVPAGRELRVSVASPPDTVPVPSTPCAAAEYVTVPVCVDATPTENTVE